LQEYERQNIDIGKIYLQHMKHFNGSNQQEYCQIDNFLGEILGYMIHESSTYSTFQSNLSHVWFIYTVRQKLSTT